MLHNFLIAPSFNSLFLTGFLLLFIFIIFVSNYKQFIQLDYYKKLNILSLFTIAIGIHGLLHLGMEQNYGFNPYKWI